jgi:hypothetical protein
VNEEALAHWGAVVANERKKKERKLIYCVTIHIDDPQ